MFFRPDMVLGYVLGVKNYLCPPERSKGEEAWGKKVEGIIK
jgi:hypothetical protein